jgi:3-isopropylmalate dehydrogenase
VTTYGIAAIPGDGVGPEVVAAGRAALDAAGAAFGFDVEWTEIAAGGNAIDRFGVAIRPEDIALAGTQDAILLGACGGPKWDNPAASVRPEQALFALRGSLGLYANLRPVTVHSALVASSPLRPELLEGVDLLIVRELTGGLYFGGRTESTGDVGQRVASDSLPYSEPEIRRVVELAFDLAASRRGHVTSVDKANVLATSRLWRAVATEIGADRPDVTLVHQLVDSCAMLLVRQPAAFDVVVTENLFGDILSDEAAVLAGSLGMLPSASLGQARTDHGTFGLYEPIHGTAPDIAGRDVANPIGTILSAAMLARWSLGRDDVATAIEAAVAGALDDGFRTGDLVPASSADWVRRVGTRAMTEAIVGRIAITGAEPSAERRRATAAAQAS